MKHELQLVGHGGNQNTFPALMELRSLSLLYFSDPIQDVLLAGVGDAADHSLLHGAFVRLH